MLSGTEILTTAQMRAIESAAMASGQVTGRQLMERAGAAVAGHIRLRWPKPGRATVLCGPGNNGGDGYVIARHLHDAGWRVRVLGLDNTPGPDAAEMKRLWQMIGPIQPLTYAGFCDASDSDVYIDAIFGIGLTRRPEGEIGGIIGHFGYLKGAGGIGDWQSFNEKLVAVDCPSGLCLDSGAFLGEPRGPGEFDPHARLTVTFDSPKPGHLLERGPDCCGELVVADIGLEPWRIRFPQKPEYLRVPRLTAISPEFQIRDGRRLESMDQIRSGWLSKRTAASPHKYNHGHALILAGDRGQGGAARLSARGALRVGAGLVTICPPSSALGEHAGLPDAVMRRGIDDAEALSEMLRDDRIRALCLGPGCGISRAALLLPEVLASRRATVLDADALTAMAASSEIRFDGLHENVVLTPHMGEFSRLFPDLSDRLKGPPPPDDPGEADPDCSPAEIAAFRQEICAWNEALQAQRGPAYSRLDAARDAAARSGAVILLKGPDTVIVAPDGTAVIHSAFDTPWLATAGSGDVLAGIITGLLARGLPALDAAANGVYLHAAAARRFGPGLIADDLPEQIPGIFREMELSVSGR